MESINARDNLSRIDFPFRQNRVNCRGSIPKTESGNNVILEGTVHEI